MTGYPAMNWYVHPSGNELNGGGFDATVSGAGTNYCDANQSTPIVNVADAVTNGTTTITSATAAFTAAMVGNVVRIVGDGYYVILTRNSATSITVDRATANGGSGRSIRVGGAHAGILSYAISGGSATPILTSPLAPGHTINIRGGGTDDPASLDYTATDYLKFPDGDDTNGVITWKGSNGRPCLSPTGGMIFYAPVFHRFTGLKLKNVTGGLVTYGIINGGSNVQVDDVYVDAAGVDGVGVTAEHVFNCWFKNSVTWAQGSATRGAIHSANYAGLIAKNRIDKWPGPAVDCGSMSIVRENVITGCGWGVYIPSSVVPSYAYHIQQNTIDSCANDGIYLGDANTIVGSVVLNNILTRNGGYGINCAVGAAAFNVQRVAGRVDYNNFGTGAYANTSGARNNLSAGAHDVALDPQFTNAAAGDYSVGTNMAAIGFPGLLPG